MTRPRDDARRVPDPRATIAEQFSTIDSTGDAGRFVDIVAMRCRGVRRPL